MKKKIGDIYYNPYAGDLWFLNKIWDNSKNKDVWTLNLIHDDLQEQLKDTKGFVKIGNVYNMIRERQELINYLKEEQDRLSKECSQIYEDGLGKKRLVNKDIYNEVSKILSKIEKSDNQC